MKQVITDIARGEVDLDTLKVGASLIPVAKITKVPKVVKAIGNVGKTGLKKGKEGDKTVWKRFTREDKPKPDKNKGNQSKAGSKSGITTSKSNQEEALKSGQAKQTKAKNKGKRESKNLTTGTKVRYGEHYIKGKNRRKKLKPNIEYTTSEGYKYTTDKQGRISSVEVRDLKLGQAKRNEYAQRNVGGNDREEGDHGGHLIASQFKGSGDIDNLVAQAGTINRNGGKWYNMEKEWRYALKTNKKVSNIEIRINYESSSKRPTDFTVKYQIEGKDPITRKILNKGD